MRNKGLDSVCKGEWCQLSHRPQVQDQGPVVSGAQQDFLGMTASDQHWEFRQCRGAQRQCFRLHAPFSFKVPKATGHSGSLCHPPSWGGNTAEQRPWEEGRSRLTLHSESGVNILHPNARETKLPLSIPQAQPLSPGLGDPPLKDPWPRPLSQLPSWEVQGKAADKEAVPGTGDTCPRTGLPTSPAPTKGRAWPLRPGNVAGGQHWFCLRTLSALR